MQNNKKVGCVVVNFNDASTTMSLMDRIKKYNVFSKIVIVDNCSTDNSIIMLSPLESSLVHIIKLDKNKGYGEGNNAGIKYLHNELGDCIIVVSNPDVIFSEDSIENIANTFVDDDQLGVVSMIQLNKERKTFKGFAWNIPSVWQYIFSSLFFASKFHNVSFIVQGVNKDRLSYVECVSGAFLALDSSKMLKVGGYDPRIFLYGEETVLGIKMKRFGFKTAVINDDFYIHYHESSTKKNIPSSMRRRKLLLKSRMFILKEYLNATPFQIIMAKICFRVSIVEETFKQLIKTMRE